VAGDPFVAYVEQCWQTRPSSISVKLSKQPPQSVREVLKKIAPPDETNVRGLQSKLRSKFRLFQKWVHLQHGNNSNPSVWSDTLSKFASVVNPHVDRYNKMVEPQLGFLHATSFVPADLAPEMYRRGQTATGYFIMGQGWIYAYSAIWRRDAYAAFLQKRLPKEVQEVLEGYTSLQEHVSVDLAYRGRQELLEGLEKAGVSEMTFTSFLRRYYWSGAFLEVNLHDDWEFV